MAVRQAVWLLLSASVPAHHQHHTAMQRGGATPSPWPQPQQPPSRLALTSWIGERAVADPVVVPIILSAYAAGSGAGSAVTRPGGPGYRLLRDAPVYQPLVQQSGNVVHWADIDPGGSAHQCAQAARRTAHARGKAGPLPENWRRRSEKAGWICICPRVPGVAVVVSYLSVIRPDENAARVTTLTR